MDFGHGRFYRGKDALIIYYTHSDSFCKGKIVKFCVKWGGAAESGEDVAKA